jgi:hypothetical protein
MFIYFLLPEVWGANTCPAGKGLLFAIYVSSACRHCRNSLPVLSHNPYTNMFVCWLPLAFEKNLLQFLSLSQTIFVKKSVRFSELWHWRRPCWGVPFHPAAFVVYLASVLSVAVAHLWACHQTGGVGSKLCFKWPVISIHRWTDLKDDYEHLGEFST